MDPRVKGNRDVTLYLADWPETPEAKQRSHGLLYHATLYDTDAGHVFVITDGESEATVLSHYVEGHRPGTTVC